MDSASWTSTLFLDHGNPPTHSNRPSARAKRGTPIYQLFLQGGRMTHMPLTVPVYFTPDMVAESNSFSPSSSKPEAVVSDWIAAGLPIEVRDFAAVTRKDLYRAHDRAYVDGVLDLKVANGFGDRSPQIARSLPFTSGAMLAAAEEALINRCVAVAPVSGFHHAGFDGGGGYCTFNGLVVTAMALRAAGFAERVGILDLDQHWGNGTADIIDVISLDYIEHYSAGAEYSQPQQSADFLRRLPKIVERFRRCDVLLYQAGADPHIDDPLGGWLTTAEPCRRDRIVFETARQMAMPVAWNLAGGYQRDSRGRIEPVLRIHRNTMRACVACFAAAESIPC
jgi:acetoin utilization deacetylase AcuC-like enzyme